MNFVLQCDLRRVRPDIHLPGWAFAFVCNGYEDEFDGCQCETWNPDAGAGTVIVRERAPLLGRRGWRNPAPKEYPERRLFYQSREAAEAAAASDPFAQAVEDAAKFKRGVKVSVPSTWNPPIVLDAAAEPEWVYGEQTPACQVCGGPMTLLFQIRSEISEGAADRMAYWLPFGDASPGYAFWCIKGCGDGRGVFFWQ